MTFRSAFAKIIPLCLFSLFLCALLISIVNDMYAFVKSDTTLTLNVEYGTDIDTLSQMLCDGGIIKNPTIFSLYVRSKNKDSALLSVSGSQTLSATMSYRELLSEILKIK